MSDSELSTEQIAVIEAPAEGAVFLEGPAGSGKTTVGVERLLALMEAGIAADSILLMVPQRTLAEPYYEALYSLPQFAGAMPSVLTIGGLARRMVDLFWPLAAEKAGFANPDQPPVFLTLETTQYYMARLVSPMLAEGHFDSVVINRNRLYSQLADNLNKAAAVGFALDEIGERLISAEIGEEAGQQRVYEDVQTAVSLFRRYCLEHNLLDFSLQMEVFFKILWPDPICKRHLLQTYHHLIYDNIEEDVPVAHDLLQDWLPEFDSALLIYDLDAGYRRFLGADPQTAYDLRQLCQQQHTLRQSFVTPNLLTSFSEYFGEALHMPVAHSPNSLTPEDIPQVLVFGYQHYYPEMLDWVAGQIDVLVNENGVPPNEIVVLSPFLPDSLRFSLSHRLQSYGVAARSHRPSRSLKDEPLTSCLLNLTALAHPAWGFLPRPPDVSHMLLQSIANMDLIRAHLLTEKAYYNAAGLPLLLPFEEIKPEIQERVGYRLGEAYETLRQWLENYRQNPETELDLFMSRIFGELLAQPGFGFHQNPEAGAITANLIESMQKFRWIAGDNWQEEGQSLGREYYQMVQEGVIAAQYLRSWRTEEEQAVLLAPAYTFLMRNRPVSYQFWLDIGSQSWYERLYQPLTHPFVLSRDWQPQQKWTDAEEYEYNRLALYQMVSGLVRRCREQVFLGFSELSEQGSEYRGLLLYTLQRVLQNLSNGDY